MAPSAEINSSAVCTVCLEDLTDAIFTLPCHPTHTFHIECIKPWDSMEKGCPICRAKVENVLFESDKDSFLSIKDRPSDFRPYRPMENLIRPTIRGAVFPPTRPQQPPTVGIGHPSESPFIYNPYLHPPGVFGPPMAPREEIPFYRHVAPPNLRLVQSPYVVARPPTVPWARPSTPWAPTTSLRRQEYYHRPFCPPSEELFRIFG